MEFFSSLTSFSPELAPIIAAMIRNKTKNVSRKPSIDANTILKNDFMGWKILSGAN